MLSPINTAENDVAARACAVPGVQWQRRARVALAAPNSDGPSESETTTLPSPARPAPSTRPTRACTVHAQGQCPWTWIVPPPLHLHDRDILLRPCPAASCPVAVQAEQPRFALRRQARTHAVGGALGSRPGLPGRRLMVRGLVWSYSLGARRGGGASWPTGRWLLVKKR